MGDLSVGKRVRAMWEAFHGRANAYAAAMQQRPGRAGRRRWHATSGAACRRTARPRRWPGWCWRRRRIWPDRRWPRWLGRGALPRRPRRRRDDTGTARPLAIDRVGLGGPGRDGGGQARPNVPRWRCACSLPAVLSLTLPIFIWHATCAATCWRMAIWSRAWCRPAWSRWMTSPPTSRNASSCAVSPEGEESEDADPDALDEIVYEAGCSISARRRPSSLRWRSILIPRAPDAVLPEVEDAPEPSPFSALSSLKRPH